MARAYHIVQPGDTLGDIATANNTSVAKLAAINNISNPDYIYVGQKIYLTKSTEQQKPKKSSTKVVKMKQFGQSAKEPGTIFAVWEWEQKYTDYFYVRWEFKRDDKWWDGYSTKLEYDPYNPRASKMSTYEFPDNATAVRFKVRPFAKKHKPNGSNKETYRWTADWCDYRYIYKNSVKPDTPQSPSMSTIPDKSQVELKIAGLATNITRVQFKLWIEGTEVDGVVKPGDHVYSTTDILKPSAGAVTHIWNVHKGRKYKAAVRIGTSKRWSDWSEYTTDYVQTIPEPPEKIITLRSEAGFNDSDQKGSVYISWKAALGAEHYIIGYALDKKAFQTNENLAQYDTSSEANPKITHHVFSGIDKGFEYYFGVRAVNPSGESRWCDLRTLISGTAPSAPTTWSSADSIVVGDPGDNNRVYLHWQHNAKDASYERTAVLEFRTVDEDPEIVVEITKDHPNQNEEERRKPGEYILRADKPLTDPNTGATISFEDGRTIKWRVKTAGVLEDSKGHKVYGPYSSARELRVYTRPTASVLFNNNDPNNDVFTRYPIDISVQGSGFYNQSPVGCSVSVTAKNSYDSQDGTGRPVRVNAGDPVFSRYLSGEPDSDRYDIVVLPGDSLIETGQVYLVNAVLISSSGLTATASREFTAQFGETSDDVSLDASVTINPDGYTATILPRCYRQTTRTCEVMYQNGQYTPSDVNLEGAYSEEMVPVATTVDGDPVYSGVSPDGRRVMYTIVLDNEPVLDAMLSVYRREFDGHLQLIATDIPNDGKSYISDPHPALDFARYRIVAESRLSGWVEYYDMPGIPLGVPGAIIQWDDTWINYDQIGDSEAVQEPWDGSYLHLPYNLDITEDSQVDVTTVNYIGRAHPVAYYGTQVGQTANWTMAIPSDDKQTIYALRRLARWAGNVYVREQSGSGYWATVQVSMDKKHCEVITPVTLQITRVEGGEA